jgi:hypothetical protein
MVLTDDDAADVFLGRTTKNWELSKKDHQTTVNPLPACSIDKCTIPGALIYDLARVSPRCHCCNGLSTGSVEVYIVQPPTTGTALGPSSPWPSAASE